MSLHAQLNPEALERLRKQKRNSTVSSILSAVMFIAIIVVGLGFILIPTITKEEVEITTYIGPESTTDDPEPTQKKTRIQRKPAASATAAPVIATASASAVSIPVPDVQTDAPSTDFGMSDSDFGTAWGTSDFGAEGGGSMFGSSRSISGALKGHLYDLKQTPKGKKLDYNAGQFTKIALEAEKRDFSDSAFREFFQAPKELNLTNVAVAYTSAAEGPKYFGAEDSIKPSGWIAAYHGIIAAPESGKYRFRAASDDYLVALVDKKRNLVACWPGLQEAIAGNFTPSKQEGNTQSPLGGAKLHAGEWMDLRAGSPFELALAIGERPGGMVGFILEVEKKGENYRTTPSGRKILPLFTTHPFTESEQKEIQERFGNYELEWDNVPIFGIR